MDIFGGGLAGHGEICGAVIGALAVLGLKFGRSSAGDDADLRMWLYAYDFLARFRSEVGQGNILCREIAGVDWRDSAQLKQFREGPGRLSCQKLTGQTAKLLGELLEKALS